MSPEVLYSKLKSHVSLRDDIVFYGPPSEPLSTQLGYKCGPGKTCLETGVSPLSFAMAARGATVTCIVPDEVTASSIRSLIAAFEPPLAEQQLVVRAGPVVDTIGAVPRGSMDVVVLAHSPSFPLYHAVVYQAMARLKIGGTLFVRGLGVLPIDQLRSFLRIEPGWTSCELIDDESMMIIKGAPSLQPRWQDQPYVVLNSAGAEVGAVTAAAKRIERSQVRSFSRHVDAVVNEKQERASHLRASNLSKPMRVGLVGYYGFGNYGDELFRSVFEDALPDCELQPVHDIIERPYFISPKAKKIAACDAILIGGGDLVIPQYWTDIYFEKEYLTKPVFIHGVGVPTWTGQNDWIVGRLREFFQHPNVKSINVRDQESVAWIEKNLNPNIPVDSSPDLVFGMKALQQSTRAGATPTLGLITRMHSDAQSKYQNLEQFCLNARAKGYRIVQIIAGSGVVGREDLAHAQKYPLSVDEVVAPQNIDDITSAIASCDVVASMKFHGCVVGLALGKPTISLITTDKFVNLYNRLGIQDMICHFWTPAIAQFLERPVKQLPEAKRTQLFDLCQDSLGKLARQMDALVNV